MKISGQKNDGAWFRANRALRKLTETERASITARIAENSLFAELAFNDMLALAAETGVDSLTMPGTTSAWISHMMEDGIPRQIWMGRLTFTTYAEVDGKIVGNYQSNIHYFAHELRKFVITSLKAFRQVKDVFNIGNLVTGNPGGLPDGDKEN